MLFQLVYAAAKGLQALAGSGPAPGGQRYTLHPVHPTRMGEFAAAHPRAGCAEACLRVLRERGLRADADALAEDIRRVRRRHPGCLVSITLD